MTLKWGHDHRIVRSLVPGLAIPAHPSKISNGIESSGSSMKTMAEIVCHGAEDKHPLATRRAGQT
jgi:hypothetical protein